jgi:F-type H+-transporting ATPase subunit gamma
MFTFEGRTSYMSGKLRFYKEKLEGYKKFYSIVKTIRMVTLAKYRTAQVRVKTRDYTLRYSEKAFSQPQFDEMASIATAHNPIVYVPVTSNRGSCGALNSNAFKYIDSIMSKNCNLVVVGKKGNDSLFKLFPAEFKMGIINDMKQPMHFAYATFVWENVQTIENAERVQILFNRYVSAGSQRQAVYNIPSFQKWLDGLGDAASTENQKDRYLFANALLNEDEELIRDYYDFHAALTMLNAVAENELSEQAARLIAVEGQLTNIQTLQHRTNSLYNKTRQGSITAALIEILSAMNAMEGNSAKGVKRLKFWEGAKQ